MKVGLARAIDVIHIIIDSVSAQDLVGDIQAQHDVPLILKDGSHKPRPELQPIKENQLHMIL
jgi:hypothetical protein